jgi:hypothetical protein
MTLTFFSDLEDSSGLAERLGADYAPVLPAARELLGALHLGRRRTSSG